jgi:RNA polymerase sigma factor (sigma-70 family)
MYGRKANGDLKQSQLEEAQLGFVQFLRRKRFSPQFIESHGEDLFATAALEYSRKIAEGTHIESPAGWLITCAWRRTMSLLEAQSRSPQVIATEKAEAIEDEVGRSPEQAALDGDRFRRVHEAVAQLPLEEQRLLELAYFEEMPVREAARQLDWHPSKAQRRHEAARERLLQLLGVESLDELEIDIGLAAYVSVLEAGSSSLHLPEPLTAMAESVSNGVSYAWGRAHELARRLPLGGGGEPSAVALGGAGRAAGICATAAMACLASGVVGPGLGGVNPLSGSAPSNPPARHGETAFSSTAGRAVIPSETEPPRALASVSPNGDQEGGRQKSESGRSRAERREREASDAVASQSLESGAAGSGVTAEPEPEPTATVSSLSEPNPPSGSSSSSNPTEVANQQFGP